MEAPPSLNDLVKELRISLALLEQKCSDEHLKNISLFLDWRRVAPHLGLDKTDIDEIESKKTDFEKRLETLQKWKMKYGFRAKFKNLVQVLLKVGNADHAEKVCQLLQHADAGSVAITASVTPSDQLQGTPVTTVEPNTPQITIAMKTDSKAGSQKVTIEKEIEELENRFLDLVNKTEDDLEDTPLSKVKRSIMQLPVSIRYQHIKFLERNRSVITNAGSISEVFSILRLYWDFLNCGLLRVIVWKCGEYETNQLMDEYLEKLRDFRQHTKLGDFIDKWLGGCNLLYYEEFATEMGESWKEYTLEDLEKFRIQLSRRLSFTDYAMVIKKVTTGSVTVLWALHCSFALTATLLQDALPLLQESNVQRVVSKGICILKLDSLESNCPVAAVEDTATGFGPAPQWEEYEPVRDKGEEYFCTAIGFSGTVQKKGEGRHEEEQGDSKRCSEDQFMLDHDQVSSSSGVELEQDREEHTFQRRERELLFKLLELKPKQQNPRPQELLYEPQGGVATSQESLFQPCGDLLFDTKNGGFVADRSDCMFIASVGSEPPAGVEITYKPQNNVRAHRALKTHGRLPHTVTRLPEGTEVDLIIASSTMRQNPKTELVSLSLDLPGRERSRNYYLKEMEKFFKRCERPGAVIWYTGHSEQKTGNWCFKDGTISFQEIFVLYRTHFSGRLLHIVSDCCYSGKWVHTCAETLDNMGIPPCGHKAREQGVMIKINASCQADQKAEDPCYSIEGVWFSEETQYIYFWNDKQFTECQRSTNGNFTKIVCCKRPDDLCPAGSVFKQWKWVDVVSGEVANSIYTVRGENRGVPVWNCVLLSSGDEEYAAQFFAQTGTVDIADWGCILASGQGKDPPQNIEDKILQWTSVSAQ